MSINLSALMKQRYDTAANWTAQNPTLLAGEIGIESDTKRWKIGSGSTAWTSLTYANGSTYPFVNADIAAGAEIAVSKLADGSARQLLQTDAAGTGVEWTSDVSIPGALSVTGNVNIDGGTLYVDAVNNRVGINTTGPTTALQLVGTARFGNGTAGTVALTSDSNLSYYDSLNNAATAFQPSVLRATEFQFHTNTAGTAPVQKAVIDSSGRLLVGVSANANGGILQLSSGITFPATAVAASDVNTLDDYEEGTWTPAYAATFGTLGAITYVNVQGTYTKIGRLVTVTGGFYCSAFAVGTGSGDLLIGGLPFANAANLNAISVGDSRLFTLNNPTGGQVNTSASNITLFYRTTANGGINVLQVSDAATGSGAINLVYFTASYQTS